MEGMNVIKIHCKHICKCHNAYSPHNYYMLYKCFVLESKVYSRLNKIPNL
jgi:hypothetical protein